jgi:hypothetical protein
MRKIQQCINDRAVVDTGTYVPADTVLVLVPEHGYSIKF